MSKGDELYYNLGQVLNNGYQLSDIFDDRPIDFWIWFKLIAARKTNTTLWEDIPDNIKSYHNFSTLKSGIDAARDVVHATTQSDGSYKSEVVMHANFSRLGSMVDENKVVRFKYATSHCDHPYENVILVISEHVNNCTEGITTIVISDKEIEQFCEKAKQAYAMLPDKQPMTPITNPDKLPRDIEQEISPFERSCMRVTDYYEKHKKLPEKGSDLGKWLDRQTNIKKMCKEHQDTLKKTTWWSSCVKPTSSEMEALMKLEAQRLVPHGGIRDTIEYKNVLQYVSTYLTISFFDKETGPWLREQRTKYSQLSQDDREALQMLPGWISS